jgi:hypothetical protein
MRNLGETLWCERQLWCEENNLEVKELEFSHSACSASYTNLETRSVTLSFFPHLSNEGTLQNGHFALKFKNVTNLQKDIPC